jgi:hypothetical protein
MGRNPAFFTRRCSFIEDRGVGSGWECGGSDLREVVEIGSTFRALLDVAGTLVGGGILVGIESSVRDALTLLRRVRYKKDVIIVDVD